MKIEDGIIEAKVDDRHRKLLREILWQDRQGDDGFELAAQLLADFERDTWRDAMREAFEATKLRDEIKM